MKDVTGPISIGLGPQPRRSAQPALAPGANATESNTSAEQRERRGEERDGHSHQNRPSHELIHGQSIEGDDVDPYAIDVREAVVGEARHRSVSNDRVNAVAQAEYVQLPVDHVSRKASTDVL